MRALFIIARNREALVPPGRVASRIAPDPAPPRCRVRSSDYLNFIGGVA